MMCLYVQVTMSVSSAEVVRGGKWQVVPSSQLVPGDVIKIASDWLLPCDCVIIQGTCFALSLPRLLLLVQLPPLPKKVFKQHSKLHKDKQVCVP